MSLTMRPDSRASRVLAILAEGPATTGEVAAETGWGVHLTCAHLFSLLQRGKISRSPFKQHGARTWWLWSLKESA
jgi:hypothetical protein